MIVRNEAHQLGEALASFRSFADEIVVVDTGSTDDSKAVARQFTSKVFEFPWRNDFAAARNVSLEKAGCDYILWLDADDRVHPADQLKICALKRYFDGSTAFYFIVRDTNPAESSYSLYQVRCAPRSESIRFQGRVHEKLTVDELTLANTDIVIYHHGYQDPVSFARKVRRNVQLLELELDEGRDDEQIHFYLALSYDHLGRLNEAVEHMNKCLARLEHQARSQSDGSLSQSNSLPRWLEAHLFLAERFLIRGEHVDALRHLAKVSALAGEQRQPLCRLACLYQDLGRHFQALDCFRQAMKSENSLTILPAKPLSAGWIQVRMAYSFLCLQQRERAQECLNEALQSGVDASKSWEQLGCAALNARQYESALLAYETALQYGRLSADGYCNLGLLYSKQTRSQNALDCYTKSLEQQPDHPDALANLAHLHLRMGHYCSAKEVFGRLVATGRHDLGALLALSLIAAREQDRATFVRLAPLFQPLFPLMELAPGANEEAFFSRLSDHLRAQGMRQLSRWAAEIAAIGTKLSKR